MDFSLLLRQLVLQRLNVRRHGRRLFGIQGFDHLWAHREDISILLHCTTLLYQCRAHNRQLIRMDAAELGGSVWYFFQLLWQDLGRTSEAGLLGCT